MRTGLKKGDFLKKRGFGERLSFRRADGFGNEEFSHRRRAGKSPQVRKSLDIPAAKFNML